MTSTLSIQNGHRVRDSFAKLKAKDINVSKAFCTALVAYWEKKVKEKAD